MKGMLLRSVHPNGTAKLTFIASIAYNRHCLWQALFIASSVYGKIFADLNIAQPNICAIFGINAVAEQGYNMKRGVKTALIIVCAAIIVAAGVLLAINLNKEEADPVRKHSIVYFENYEDANTYLFYDTTKLEGYIGGSIDSYLTCDGSVIIMRAGTGLYRADEKGILKVYPIGVDRAVLSLDNRFILFSTATKAYIYDSQSEGLTEIENLNAEDILSLVISPNAEAFAVSVLDSDDRSMTYVYKDGNTELLREDSCIVAIGDDGESGYYVGAVGKELTGKLYYIGKEDKLIAENVEANFELSRDLKEITFDIDAKTHYSVAGSKAKKLLDASVITYAGKTSCAMGGEYCTSNIKNVSSIFDCIYYTVYTSQDANSNLIKTYDLYYVTSAHSVTPLVKGTTRFVIGNSGKDIACQVDGTVYTVSAYNPKNPIQVMQNAYTFTCSDELEEFYVVDNYAGLYYTKVNSTPVKVLDNAYFIIMGRSNTCLCINDYENESGTLHWIRGTETNEIADGVYSVETMNGGTVYYTNGDTDSGVFDVYMSEDDKNFDLAMETVQLGKQD